MNAPELAGFDARVIDHYEDPYGRGAVEGATHAADGDILLCGDRIRFELRLSDQGQIEGAGFDGDGCVVSQAAASMLAEHVEGMSVAAARQFAAPDMLALFASPLPPSRQRCCLLAWRVMQQALDRPVGAAEDDLDALDALDRNFGGPSLSEES